MSSGGHRHGKARLPVEACHSISAWGYYTPAQMWAFDSGFTLECTFDRAANAAQLHYVREGLPYTQQVRLKYTRCAFGNQRVWFACPMCSRRVGKLYLPETLYIGNQHCWWFACRQCFGLTYLQRRERSKHWTMNYRAERIAARWLGDVSRDDWIARRKGQHWQTFNRRADQWEQTIQHAEAGYMETPLLRRLMKQAGITRPAQAARIGEK